MPRTYIRHERAPREERRFQVYRPWWVDPFWWIQGSSIEKMVMAELVRRGIYFEYRPQSNSLGGFVDPTWEPDFLFPQFRIWLEIQGAYFHSLPGQIETDALRAASVEHAGWRFLAWWEWDIRGRLPELLDAVPEFYRVDLIFNRTASKTYGLTSGLPFYTGATVDQLKGLRAANARRRRPEQLIFRRSRRGRRPK